MIRKQRTVLRVALAALLVASAIGPAVAVHAAPPVAADGHDAAWSWGDRLAGLLDGLSDFFTAASTETDPETDSDMGPAMDPNGIQAVPPLSEPSIPVDDAG